MKKELTSYGIILLILIGYLIFNSYTNIYIPCIFNKITKLYCPGCGMTRALKSLFTGHFYQAFRYNNLVYFIIIILVIYFGESFLDRYSIKNLHLKKYMNTKFFTVVIIILLLYGVLRNIPALGFLVPTKV